MRPLLLVVAAIGSRALAAQPTEIPHRRAHHALGYDESRQQVVLTGGSTPLNGGQAFAFFNDVWAFDGSRWTSLGDSGEKMSGMRLAWDAARGRLVSFGGYTGRAVGPLRALVNDRWISLGENAESPAAEPGFVFDTGRGRFVLFGGSSGPGQSWGDTWEYDGTAWTRVPVSGPAARQAHAMVYDERRGRTLLYGGMGNGPAGQRPPILGDFWEFDGHTWTQRTESGPGPRQGSGVAYDSRRGLVILFGGVGASGFLGDTWSWDGTAWRQLADSGPEPRGMGYLAYDRKRDRMVLFGGRKGWPDGDLNDTWEWDGTRWLERAPLP